ncbi:hypothetical protein Dimus_018892 [Dionaea muscipula]
MGLSIGAKGNLISDLEVDNERIDHVQNSETSAAKMCIAEVSGGHSMEGEDSAGTKLVNSNLERPRKRGRPKKSKLIVKAVATVRHLPNSTLFGADQGSFCGNGDEADRLWKFGTRIEDEFHCCSLPRWFEDDAVFYYANLYGSFLGFSGGLKGEVVSLGREWMRGWCGALLRGLRAFWGEGLIDLSLDVVVVIWGDGVELGVALAYLLLWGSGACPGRMTCIWYSPFHLDRIRASGGALLMGCCVSLVDGGLVHFKCCSILMWLSQGYSQSDSTIETDGLVIVVIRWVGCMLVLMASGFWMVFIHGFSSLVLFSWQSFRAGIVDWRCLEAEDMLHTLSILQFDDFRLKPVGGFISKVTVDILAGFGLLSLSIVSPIGDQLVGFSRIIFLRIVRIKWWDSFDLNKVHKPTPATTSTSTDQQTEYAKLQAKAAALEKELTQLKRRAAAFEDSQDPFENNDDLELFCYDS